MDIGRTPAPRSIAGVLVCGQSRVIRGQSRHRTFATSIIRQAEAYSHGNNDWGPLHSWAKDIKSQLGSNPPKEEEVIAAFQACKEYAEQNRMSVKRSTVSSKASPAAAILSLDDSSGTPRATGSSVGAISSSKSTEGRLADAADLAFSILSHPSVFITETILAVYVDAAIHLHDIKSLPAAFTLYAKKPYLPPGSATPRQTNPSLPKYAIPNPIASRAIDAAISTKDMKLALDVINTSYGAPAYRWSKIVRKALPAGTAIVLSPAALYILAQQAAQYQDVVDQELATRFAFGGLLAYLGFTGGIGLIAMTTSNDQMIRVTWLVGTPLSKRWLYEDERAAYDRLAQGWGFEDPNMR